MPIKINGNNIFNPQVGTTKLKRIMVGSNRVWPSGEAWFDWPYYTDERTSSNGNVAGMGQILEDRTAWESFAPIFAPGYSPNFTSPWWGTAGYDDNNAFCIKTPANQPASYKITGSVDVINSHPSSPFIWLTSSMTYKYGTTSYAAESTIYRGIAPSGSWVTYPIDVLLTTNFGYAQILYPFSYSISGVNEGYYPFRFANIRIGIQRVYI